MNIDDTILAFQCCTKTKPDCEHCPQQGPGFGIACRQNVKESTLYYLNVAREEMKHGQNKD